MEGEKGRVGVEGNGRGERSEKNEWGRIKEGAG